MFGVLGLAASSAPTLLEMQRTMLAHPALAWGMFETTAWREGDEAVLRWEASVDTGDCTAFFMERDTTCAVTLLRDAIDEAAAPRVVRFVHAAPPDVASYREFFRSDVLFGQAANELRFDAAAWLARPRLANAMSFRFFENQCRSLGETLARPLELASVVRSRLRSATPVPALPELAASLHLTPRTLQRRLAAEGSTFAVLLRDVRLERSRELLLRGNLGMDEIAWRLGFGDAVAFSRAFKDWTGSAPAHFRAAARA
jgi:AraC-like DNA-binding protein